MHAQVHGLVDQTFYDGQHRSRAKLVGMNTVSAKD